LQRKEEPTLSHALFAGNTALGMQVLSVLPRWDGDPDHHNAAASSARRVDQTEFAERWAAVERPARAGLSKVVADEQAC